MLRNSQISMVVHAGICIIVLFTGGLGATLFKQILFSLLVACLYFIIGSSLTNLGSRMKNFISVSAASAISLILAAIWCITYQVEVVNKYNYAIETVQYKIIKFICLYYNASIAPVTGLLGYFIKPLMFPYGLLFTFFIPSLLMWLALERKRRKEILIGGNA